MRKRRAKVLLAATTLSSTQLLSACKKEEPLPGNPKAPLYDSGWIRPASEGSSAPIGPPPPDTRPAERPHTGAQTDDAGDPEEPMPGVGHGGSSGEPLEHAAPLVGPDEKKTR